MPGRMTMTWATFASALDGHRDASAALDALTMSPMADVQAMLDGIGAGDAGPFLAQIQTDDSQERRSVLAAGLDIIDHHVPVDSQVTKPALFSRRRTWTGQAGLSGDALRIVLVASLIDAELGGDFERLRARVAMAATWMEDAFAADLKGLSKRERGVEGQAARRALRRVLQLITNELQARRAG